MNLITNLLQLLEQIAVRGPEGGPVDDERSADHDERRSAPRAFDRLFN